MSADRLRRTAVILLLFLEAAAVPFASSCAGKRDSVTPTQADTFFSVSYKCGDVGLQNALVLASGFDQSDIASYTVYPVQTGYVAAVRTEKEESFLVLGPDMVVRRSVTCPVFGQSTDAVFLMPDGSFAEIVRDLSDGWDSTVQGRFIHADGTDERFRIASLDKETIQSAKITTGGRILICTETKILIGSSFQNLKAVTFSQNILGACSGSDDQIYVWTSDPKGSELAVIDDTGKVNTLADLSSVLGLTGGIAGASEGLADEIILFGTSGIYQYLPSTKAFIETATYTDAGLSVLSNPMPTSDGQGGILFYGSSVFGDSASEGNGFLSGISIPSNPNRQKVTIGYSGSENAACQTLVNYFNICQNKYTAELQYFETDDPSSSGGEARLRASMSTEESPDVVLLFPESLQSMLQSNMLEPLDQALFADTTQTTNSGILANVQKAWTTDGTCRYIAPFFYLSGLVTANDYAEKLSTYTFSDLQNLAEDEHCAVFGTNTQSPFGALSYSLQNRFISPKDHSVSFDSQDFIRFLSFYKTIDTELKQNSGQNPKHIVIWREIHSFGDFLRISELDNTPVTMIGFPDMQADTPLVLASTYYAVSANAADKDGAFAFLSFLLSANVQSHYTSLSGGDMPVVSSYFEEMLSRDLLAYDSNSEGDTADAPNSGNKISPETREALPQTFRNLVAKSDTTYLANGNVNQLIYEELQPFLTGDKSAEETADTMQKRMRVFIWETS